MYGHAPFPEQTFPWGGSEPQGPVATEVRVVGQAHQVCLTPYLVSVPLLPGVPLPPAEALSSGLGPGIRRAGFLPEEHTCPAHPAHRWAWCWESSR